MSAVTDTLASENLVIASPGGSPARDKGQIRASFDPEDFPIPHFREEEWRFTPSARVRDLLVANDKDSAGSSGFTVRVDGADDVSVERVGRDDVRLGVAFIPVDRASALAWAGFDQATVVTIPRGINSDRPTTITVTGSESGRISYGHIRVIVEDFASGAVVLRYEGSTRLTSNVEVSVGQGGSLTLVSAQLWDRNAAHLGRIHTRLDRDARVSQLVASFGGDVVRLVSTVDYTGPGGDAELLGLFFGDAGQHLEHRLFVDHGVAHCRSDVVYKGALQGEGAHSVWIGDVLIRADAIGTSTYEINRNLLLTEGARADSVPNLEIETGQVVGAGHASATGRFDDEQLFYLQSRGISQDEARTLVVRGFFADLLSRISVPEIAELIAREVDAELGIAAEPATEVNHELSA